MFKKKVVPDVTEVFTEVSYCSVEQYLLFVLSLREFMSRKFEVWL